MFIGFTYQKLCDEKNAVTFYAYVYTLIPVNNQCLLLQSMYPIFVQIYM
jgi:hypothetical protein